MPVDRSRVFVLPGIQDLNKDQDEALALPLEGQHLIIGGPGTGKSVVALLRARRLQDDGKLSLTLVYNHLLHQANGYLFGKERSFSSRTWDYWFRCHFKNRFSSEIPTLEPNYPSGYRPIDWEAVKEQINLLEDEVDHCDKFIVIDEGQDMPPAFYEALINLGFENFYVIADQNQQMHPDRCSSRQAIENSLAIECEDTLELQINYRNTLPIALLAQYFYPDDPASPKPTLPQTTSSAIIPELWQYSMANLEDLSDRILKLSDRNPRKLIGIITPNCKVQDKFFNLLNSAKPQLDNGKPPIQTYKSEKRTELNFAEGGIMIINAQSCKGLEFDTAILADIDLHKPKEEYSLKSRFYVMISRAREQLILLRSEDVCPVVETLLPTDSSILIKRSL